jgi:hypothetical protein
VRNVDPEFKNILLRVVIIGTGIAAAGFTILIFAVRAFRGEKRMSSFAGPMLIVALLAFVMLCCFLLLTSSFG